MSTTKERDLTKKEREELRAAWVRHYESKLPRLENYRRKSLSHLGKLHGRLLNYCGLLREALSRFPDDLMAADLLLMYEAHLDVARETLLKKVFLTI